METVLHKDSFNNGDFSLEGIRVDRHDYILIIIIFEGLVIIEYRKFISNIWIFEGLPRSFLVAIMYTENFIIIIFKVVSQNLPRLFFVTSLCV